ncbi:MAG: SH3 domain-containing protein, partial [Anaerolineae bacterium]
MKRLLLLLALLTLTIAACSGDDDNDKPRPTQLLVITNEPTIEAQQMTIEALQTQVALNATATPTPLPASATPTATDTLVPAEKGVVLIDKAVVLAEPDMDAEVVGELPLSAEVSITAQTAPNRIGIVFYSIEYEDLTGWVASTQIQPVTDEPTQAAIVPTQPQRPASTSTPLPTVTSPPT